MNLSVKGLAIASAIFWGLAILITGLANLVYPSYGMAFLECMGSVYPGYQPGTGIGSVITGSIYALVDGGICGAIFAFIYNYFAR